MVRVHTRVPVADPGAHHAASWSARCKAKGKATYVVLHANHARELTARRATACARLVDAGIPMLSQSVLLPASTTMPQTLGALMRALGRVPHQAVLPASRRSGARHRRICAPSIEQGQELMRALRGRLSGLCQPTYVLDIPGGHGKSPIGPNYLSRDEAGRTQVEDFNGGLHCYPHGDLAGPAQDTIRRAYRPSMPQVGGQYASRVYSLFGST